MFEKEAEEYLGNFADCANCKERWSVCADSLDEYCLANGCCYATPKEQDIYIAGAEFGYNKANEWHYVKDGDLPKHNHEVLCLMWGGTKEIGYYENEVWHCENFVADNEDVDYWQEIVPPKEIE